MSVSLADERAAKTKLLDETKQLRKLNEVLAGHTTNAEMASNYTRIVYHTPLSFPAGEANRGLAP